MICDSCGQTSDRGGCGGLPEGLGVHSSFMGTNQPRKVGAVASQSCDKVKKKKERIKSSWVILGLPDALSLKSSF